MNTAFDLSPFTRSIIGFDRFSSLLDKANEVKVPAYPPYNIEKLNENKYAIIMAVAGFNEKDLEVTSHNGSLKVTGKITEEKEEAQKNYLYRGIASRNFERSFSLDDHVKVLGAEIKDGLLKISLERLVPEEAKPKKIEIKTLSQPTPKALENKKA